MLKNEILIQGIKYDKGSSYEAGCDLAPSLIRMAYHSKSSNFFTEDLIDLNAYPIRDKGDFKISTYFDIERLTLNHLKESNRIISLGGDHSISFPIIKALRSKYAKIDILHFDAHSDIYEEFDNSRYSHACPFARIMENKLTDKLVQVGIRTLNLHQKKQIEKYNVEVHEMKSLNLDLALSFSNPLYISLDLDVLDPSYAPGVSHYEPGGLSTREVIHVIQNLNAEVIGADIVEYNPKKDLNNITAFVAAKMMKEILSKMIKK